jgi:hypothetical protein
MGEDMTENNPYSPNNPYGSNDPYASNNPYAPPSYPPIPPASPPSYPPIPAPSSPPSSSFPPIPAQSAQSSYPAAPYSGLMTPQPERKPKTSLILIVAAVVMLAVAGTFVGLYLVAGKDHDSAVSTVEEKKTELAEVKEQYTATESDREEAESANSELESANSALTPCVEATQHYLYDNLEGAERETALDAMFTACGA